MRRLSATVSLLALVASALGAIQPPAPPGELPVLFRDDFEQGVDRWEPTDAKAWKLLDGPSGKAFAQFRQSDYKPPHRSPLNIALVKDVKAADFILEARVQSTARDYPHRSVCLFFGYQDPAHFYYVHLGQKTDDHANQIFIVNGAPRTKISTKTTPGTPWDGDWHRVKIARTAADGRIAVYFDDLQAPVMTATDKTFTWGRVGVGSFDDTANWDDVTLRGTKAEGK
jgi:hypothetical protein